MKKVSVYIKILVLLILFSCNRAEQKSVSNLGSIKDAILIDQIESNIIERKNVVHVDAIKVDTIIRSFHISYTIRDNDDVISKQSITSKGDSILLEYADRSVYLNLTFNEQVILSNKEINKQTFKSIIPKDEIEEFQLWFFGIKEVEDEGVLFNTHVCIPETDMCYFIALYISKSGDFIISEIELDEEDD